MTTPTTRLEHSMSDNIATNKDVIRTFFELLSQEKYDQAFALQDPASLVHLQSPRQSIPATDWHAVYQKLMDSMLPGGVQFQVDYLTAEDDRVSAITRGSGRIHGEDRYENHYCWLFHLRDGVIVEIHEFMDTLYANQMLNTAGWIGRREPKRSEAGTP
jgi:ketosteroid isomerase-like protein